MTRPVLRLLQALKTYAQPVAFGVSAIVEDRGNRVVLVRHSYLPDWHLPGGGVNPVEPPRDAIMRELKEEIGLIGSAPPELIGLFTRRLGLVTNVVALYRVRNAEFAFKPSWEIREIRLIDPAAPPTDIAAGSARRLAEFVNKSPPSAYW